ncbi:S66 peptidase family protein [Pseudoalteromonas fenneropenaei]|uniref:S66 peptidase family protein n=1 Tax=Pseudoalteromonas fenneropenaei TaxID=1737459 RepID=A0ABV7CG54_9GAMM
MLKFPAPLTANSHIAVTAFSSGVAAPYHPRLDFVLSELRALGFQVTEGQCLREDSCHVSAPKAQRAAELMRFLLDDTVDAVFAPWGGEFAMELLPLLDWSRLAAAKPKWLLGFSDISTILLALTCKLGWATAHGTNLMQLHRGQTDPLTSQVFNALALVRGEQLVQYPLSHFESQGVSMVRDPKAAFTLTEPSTWQALGKVNLPVSGRLFGGCLDILVHILATPYADIETFCQQYAPEGIILYFENAELPPNSYYRALMGLRMCGWFAKVNAILIGRNAKPVAHGQEITDKQAVQMAFADLTIPVLYDVDIGHLPPNLTLINGAQAELSLELGQFKLTQTWE